MNSQVGVGTTLTDRLRHVLGAEEFRSSGAVALPGVPRRIHQGRDGDSRDVFVRRWRGTAIVVHPGKNAEMRRQANSRQVGVSKEARVDDRVCNTGRHRQQPIDQPALAGQERGMRRTRQPLGQADDVFEPRFRGCDREGDRSLDHVRIVRRTIIGAVNVLQRIGDALDVAHIGDRDFGPLRLQPRAAAIFSVHHGADGIAGFQQFGNDNAARFPGRSGHDNSWLGHDHLLLRVVSGPQCCPVPMALAFALQNSPNVCGSRPVTARIVSVAWKRSSPLRKYCQRCVR